VRAFDGMKTRKDSARRPAVNPLDPQTKPNLFMTMIPLVGGS
jgi:hypothetical protein